MKKLLVVKGSARENGFTNRLVSDAVSAYKNRLEIIEFDTYKSTFSFCDGCGFCKNGVCKNRDLDGFLNEFENADVILFASPVYNGTFSAPLKALFDRFQIYYESFYENGKKSIIRKRRKALLVAASGRNGGECEYMQTQLRYACSVTNLEFLGTVLCRNTDTVPEYGAALCELKNLLERSLADEEQAY